MKTKNVKLESKSEMSFKCIELDESQECVLRSLEIGLTSKCNLNCRYCCAYNKGDHDFLPGHVAIDLIKLIPSLRRVKLSGGEVLIYFDECMKVIQYCNANGIRTQINTNGTLLDREKIRQLAQAGLNVLHFSMNFFQAKHFSHFYRIDEGIFHRIVDNIALSANTRNLDTVVETMIFRNTEAHLLDIYSYVYDLGVRKHEFQYGIVSNDEKWLVITLLPKLKVVIENLIKNKKRESALYFSCIDPKHFISFDEETKGIIAQGGIYFPPCIEGKKQLHLHSNGDILICELGHPVVIGNVFTGTNLCDLFLNKPAELLSFLAKHDCQRDRTLSRCVKRVTDFNSESHWKRRKLREIQQKEREGNRGGV